MKYINYLFFLTLFFLACKPEKKLPPKKIEHTLTITTEKAQPKVIKQDHRIDLNLILSTGNNDYEAIFDNSELQLCCYSDIIDPHGALPHLKYKKSFELYTNDNKIDTVWVYQSKHSYFKTYHNRHPEVNSVHLVAGVINADEDIDLEKVRIGMNKIAFLEQFFKPAALLKEINKLTIIENEMGEAQMSFKFENDQLKTIIIDSDYDWIDKQLTSNTKNKALLFNPKKDFTLIPNDPSNSPCVDSTFEKKVTWTLTPEEIRRVFKNAKPINGPEWHHLFGHYSCSVEGKLLQNESIYGYSINSGGWFNIHASDTTLIYGNFNKALDSLFLGSAWTDDNE